MCGLNMQEREKISSLCLKTCTDARVKKQHSRFDMVALIFHTSSIESLVVCSTDRRNFSTVHEAKNVLPLSHHHIQHISTLTMLFSYAGFQKPES
jgi:hypothetical protein